MSARVKPHEITVIGAHLVGLVAGRLYEQRHGQWLPLMMERQAAARAERIHQRKLRYAGHHDSARSHA